MVSFLDRLAANIGAPIMGTGISGAPLPRGLAAEQFFQGEPRGCAADHDVSVPRLNVDTLAAANPAAFATSPGMRTARLLPHLPTIA
jgi:hypothetical protein